MNVESIADELYSKSQLALDFMGKLALFNLAFNNLEGESEIEDAAFHSIAATIESISLALGEMSSDLDFLASEVRKIIVCTH